MICVSGVGSRSFSVLMADQIPSLDCIEKGQCFPRYLYDATGKQKDGILDATLKAFQTHYQNNTISKDQLFNYIYGVLHSPDYREKYAHNLTKELPRIPFAASFEDFCTFAEAGKQLGDLHVNFEIAKPYDGVTIDIHKKHCTLLGDLQPEDFTVEKMKHGKTLQPPHHPAKHPRKSLRLCRQWPLRHRLGHGAPSYPHRQSQRHRKRRQPLRF